MKRYVIILSSLLLLFAGCDRTNDVTAYPDLSLNVVSADVVFSAAGGEGSIVVDHPKPVSATSDVSWCTVSVSGQKISVNVSVHSSLSSRHALVTITDGKQTNYVTVSQLGINFVLERSNAQISASGGEIRVNYEADIAPTVASSVDWITGTANHALRQIVLNVAPYYVPGINRQAVVTLTVGALAVTLTVVQDGYVPTYNDFLGTFTMHYAVSNVPPANRTRSTTVSIVAAGDGATYYLKGILAPADEELCNLVATYNAQRGLVVMGQILMVRPETTNDFWWLPYSMPFEGGNYVSRTITYGMYSSDFVIDNVGVASFNMADIGGWSYGLAGFILRNYNGATNLGNVNGADGQALYFYPTFERQ